MSLRIYFYILTSEVDAYLASAELAAVAAITGRLPSVDEYMECADVIEQMSGSIYRYLSFDEIASFKAAAELARIELLAV